MRFDNTYGWILSKEEFVSCGFTENQYKDGKKRRDIFTVGRACRNRPAEIILKKMAPRYQEVIKQKMARHMENHFEIMTDAKMQGADMTETAVKVTADSLKVNEPFIEAEIKDYIDKNYGQYTPHYLMRNLTGMSVIGYAKLCAFAVWLHGRVINIYNKSEEGRDRNRLIRSLKANVLMVLPNIKFGVKIPTNDIRFTQWMDDVVSGLSGGKPIEEIIEVKRAGNTNQTRLTPEQKNIAMKLYVEGNGMPKKQLWEKMIEIGRLTGWWRDAEGNYKPVAYNTVSTVILENENRLRIEREGLMSYRNNLAAEFMRSYPTKKNLAWGIDGTAHNEHVYHNGNVRQYAYVIRVFDYATLRLLACKVCAGAGEPAEAVIGAIQEAIRSTGYKPTLIQSDKGPAFEQMKAWCENTGVHVLPTGSGRARSKVIEQLFGQTDNLIIRHLKGYTGQNRTSQGTNSRPSDKYFESGKQTARGFAQVSDWVRNDAMSLWNDHVIETYEDRPLNKTPMELWHEKESDTPLLPFLELVRIAGIIRKAQLTPKGVTLRYENEKYVYFPPIATEDERQKADTALASVPVGNGEGSQVELYMTEIGQHAAVYKGDRFLGIWELKKRIGMFATFEEDANLDDYYNMKAFQNLQENNAKDFVENVKNEAGMSPSASLVDQIASEPLTGKIRKGRYDKEELNAAEIMEKSGTDAVNPVEELQNELDMFEWREAIDESTGEIYRVKVLKK